MHEMSITQGIVDICLKNCLNRSVKAVILEIGLLSGVVPDAVEFCFEACSNGTLLEGSILEIRKTEGLGRCLTCSKEQPLLRIYDPCVSCGSFGMEILSGEEMRVVEIEIED